LIQDFLRRKSIKKKALDRQPFDLLLQTIKGAKGPKAQPSQYTHKPCSLKRSKTFTEQMQEMLNKAKSASRPVADSSMEQEEAAPSQERLIQSVGAYHNYDKYRTLSTATEQSPGADEMRDLIGVLAKQNDKFKTKFFECLMMKLLDTKLPINEYLQLNRLMTALFGEAYHTLEPGLSVAKQADYLSQTRNSKADAGHVARLLRAYRDSNDPVKQRAHMEERERRAEESGEFEFVTVSSLLESLRVRQRAAGLDSSETDHHKFEFSFRNGFNGLQGDCASLALKVR